MMRPLAREPGLKGQGGNLDVVAWKPFADRRPGKLILYGARCIV